MKQIFVNVLYKKGRDLILFGFNFDENETEPVELICFHFSERHDFNERMKSAKSIFKNFYDKPNDGEEEFIDYEEIR